ncbi:uncharacterized protein N7483_004548 [Penicillium malachiteum]|uniref:uncharacterized protein n=1 Tax=Penicillium malachiteum TaxID=1324776 RepID=UPI002546FBF2|nr:uncharacterized protein N7483_004548 [Penicillium malachiteum]KAJ5730040.1 hypothetical protein N7483_004548 [Penicillium malachiteum]
MQAVFDTGSLLQTILQSDLDALGFDMSNYPSPGELVNITTANGVGQAQSIRIEMQFLDHQNLKLHEG